MTMIDPVLRQIMLEGLGSMTFCNNTPMEATDFQKKSTRLFDMLQFISRHENQRSRRLNSTRCYGGIMRFKKNLGNEQIKWAPTILDITTLGINILQDIP
jgi:hypothetical protein